MKSRQFRPTAIDTLEDRVVPTAFTVPFSLVTPPASEVNPRFLNLTGRTESQINNAINSAFHKFNQQVANAYHSYSVALAKSGADSSALYATLQGKVTNSLNTLAHSLSNVTYKLPYGHENLNPVLQNRILGTTGVTDTTTKVNTPSLQTQLGALTATSTVNDAKAAINATQTLVTADVNNYIHLGVANNYFKLTRGATYPPLS